MPFGKNKPDKDFTAEMVIALDTVQVEETSTRVDTSGKYPKRWITRRQCGKLPTNVKDKVAILHLNKDCDISTQVLNAQEAGALAVILIHSTDSRDSVALPKKSATVRYDNDTKITIPCFTVRKGMGDKLTEMLPSLVGMKRPKADIDTIQALQTPIVHPLATEQPANKAKIAPNTPTSSPTETLQNDPFTDKTGWDISPNPAGQEVTLRYNFATVAQLSIEVFNEAGQLVTNYTLSDTQSGTLTMDVSALQSGSYTVRLTNAGVREVKRLVVVR